MPVRFHLAPIQSRCALHRFRIKTSIRRSFHMFLFWKWPIFVLSVFKYILQKKKKTSFFFKKSFSLKRLLPIFSGKKKVSTVKNRLYYAPAQLLTNKWNDEFIFPVCKFEIEKVFPEWFCIRIQLEFLPSWINYFTVNRLSTTCIPLLSTF